MREAASVTTQIFEGSRGEEVAVAELDAGRLRLLRDQAALYDVQLIDEGVYVGKSLAQTLVGGLSGRRIVEGCGAGTSYLAVVERDGNVWSGYNQTLGSKHLGRVDPADDLLAAALLVLVLPGLVEQAPKARPTPLLSLLTSLRPAPARRPQVRASPRARVSASSIPLPPPPDSAAAAASYPDLPADVAVMLEQLRYFMGDENIDDADAGLLFQYRQRWLDRATLQDIVRRQQRLYQMLRSGEFIP